MLPSIARCAAFLLALTPAWSQSQISWVDHLDGPSGYDDRAAELAIAPNGNVIVVGGSGVTPSIYYPQTMFTAAWSPAGSRLWSAAWTSPGAVHELGLDVAVDAAGTIYAAGESQQPSAISDAVVVRYDANGSFLGSTLVPFLVKAVAIEIGASGDVFLAGPTRNDTPRRVGVVRLTPALALVWQSSFATSASGQDFVTGLAIGTAGEVYVSTTQAVSLVAFTAAGGFAWSHTISGCTGRVVRAHPSGGAVLGGWISASGVSVVSRLTSSGVESWRTTLAAASSYDTTLSDLQVDPFGRTVAAGTAWDSGPLGAGLAAWAIETNGSQMWEARWDCSVGDDFVSALAIDAGGEILVAGFACYVGPHVYDSDLVAWGLDPLGRTKFAEVYAPPLVPSGLEGKDVRDCAALPGGGFVLAGQENLYSSGGTIDLLVLRVDNSIESACFGDGSGTACPCGNTSPPAARAGCVNSLGNAGNLGGFGSTRISADTLSLVGNGMPSAPALYFQGTTLVGAGAGAPFGDGLRCAGGTVVRLGIRTNVAGASEYPGPGGTPVSIAGLVTAPGVRAYQVWYRNAAAFCTSATFNLTNGVSVVWTP